MRAIILAADRGTRLASFLAERIPKCLLKIGKDVWYELKKNKDFTEVIEQIDDLVKGQKFAGAAAGLLLCPGQFDREQGGAGWFRR